MKIATFNINNMNKRHPNHLAWLGKAKPDVVFLQELKATDRKFPATALANAGYGALWKGQTSWNGVAILARNAEPVLTQVRLPGNAGGEQARYIEAAVGGVLVASIYCQCPCLRSVAGGRASLKEAPKIGSSSFSRVDLERAMREHLPHFFNSFSKRYEAT